jgi:hypothetical protein
MIIKRWNGTAFVEEHPKTKAQLIFNDANNTAIFDANDKIKPAFLPNSVFDSLYFLSGIGSGPLNLSVLANNAFVDATARSPLGYYWVSTGLSVLSPNDEAVLVSGKYYSTNFNPAEEGTGNTFDSETLEAGDWIIITGFTGLGTIGSPYDVTFAVVNNTYENATTALDGIVRLSSRTTYASLSGNNVVSEGTLKTVIDNAAFASGTHVHGNILNGGTITSTVVAPADTDVILMSDTSNSGKVERGIAIGTSTTTFLNNAGGWTTPAGTFVHPTQTAITANATDNGINVIDSVTVNTLGHVTAVGTRNLSAATNAAPGHMTAAQVTKLEGIATGAQVNVATNLTYTDSTRVIGSSTGTGATLPVVVAAGISGLMTGADKTKLDGIAAGANNFVHPTQTAIDVNATDDGINVIDRVQVNTAGHVTAVSTRNLSAATASVPGHMTAAYASKLDGITAGATNQTALALGGLQISSNAFSMVHPLFVQTATPATPLTGTVWLDIN